MKFHLVLTATVHPKGMHVKITDSQTRTRQYLDALRELLTAPNPYIASITWIENSGADLSVFQDLVNTSNPYQLPVELIGLDLNDFPRELGLGYGEFHALDEGLNRSKLIKPDGYAVKLTGRLIVKNLADILKNLPEKFDLAADIRPHNRRDKGWVDSRLMAFSSAFYSAHLVGMYRKINGSHGIAAEHILYDVIRQNPGGRYVTRLPREPRWVGFSASNGMRYDSIWMRIKYWPKAVVRSISQGRPSLERIFSAGPVTADSETTSVERTGSAPLRIVYAAGPGDVFQSYLCWREERDDPSQVSITKSSQFFDVCKKYGDEALVIYHAKSSPLPPYTKWIDGRFIFERRPDPLKPPTGAMWHLSHLLRSFRFIATTLRYRADVLVIVCGTCHWFPLAILHLFGVEIVPSLHCVLWPKNRPTSTVWRWTWKINSFFFRYCTNNTLAMSDDIRDQLMQATHGQYQSISLFLPTYREATFAGISRRSRADRPFRVMYAGRMEEDKGIFDLLTIAKRFAAAGRTDIWFDLCGAGSGLERVRAEAIEAGVADRFVCHGHLNRTSMRKLLDESHVVIVPTTSAFVEGFNMVVVEGILSNRPVITSAICPAIVYVRDAIVEVAPDDVQGYGDAIIALADIDEFYETKRAAAEKAHEQFFDFARSWRTALDRALQSVRDKRSNRTQPTFSPEAESSQAT